MRLRLGRMASATSERCFAEVVDASWASASIWNAPTGAPRARQSLIRGAAITTISTLKQHQSPRHRAFPINQKTGDLLPQGALLLRPP
jgi:hypothetical protein